MSVPLPGPSTSTPSLHLAHIPAIAVSYGVIARPVPEIVSSLAHEAAVEVCERLWNDWGYEQSSGGQKRKVQLYTVNIPLQEDVLVKENRKMCWTTMWRNYYGQLFKPTKL
jgi:tubulin--tyrosine ligase